MIKSFLTLVVATLALFSTQQAFAEKDMTAKPTAVRFYADWCGSCKKLDTKLWSVRPEYEDKIKFVVLDMTSDETKAAAATKAEKLGLTDIYKEYSGKTGLMVLVDENGTFVEAVDSKKSAEDIRASFNKLTGV